MPRFGAYKKFLTRGTNATRSTPPNLYSLLLSHCVAIGGTMYVVHQLSLYERRLHK